MKVSLKSDARRLSRHSRKTPLGVVLCLTLLALGMPATAQEDASITVHFDSPLGPVNTRIFGNNQVAYDPMVFGVSWHDAYSNYGAGLWDPVARQIVPAVKTFAEDSGMTVSRFPGGLGAQPYDWKQAVGPVGGRPNWQFGPAEFIETCQDTGAVPLITLSSFVGGAQDMADFVEFLNSPDDGSHPWAATRTATGYPSPFGVVYFEFGNECYIDWMNGQERRDIQDYIDRFNAAAVAMKAVDPNVKLGVIITCEEFDTEWNELVLPATAANADFVVVHTYPVAFDPAYAEPGTTAEDVFRASLAISPQVARILDRLNNTIAQRTGRSDLMLAVTEYNGVFIGDVPVPYRFSLGNALLNAEFLRTWTQPGNNVLMANHWQFINEFWGQVSGPQRGEAVPYVTRPNFYPFNLYTHHFGTTLLQADTVCPTYETPALCGVWPSSGAGAEFQVISGDLIAGQTWTILPVAGVDVTVQPNQLSYVFPTGLDTYWQTLMETTDNIAPDKTYRFSAEVKFSRSGHGIQLSIGDSRGWDATQSATVADATWMWKDRWCAMHADYTTLSDATGLQLILYRQPYAEGDTIEVRNWAIHEITPDELPATPCLSVNASRNSAGDTAYVMVVNKDMANPITAAVNLEHFIPASMQAWVLNGPSVDSTNESVPNTVGLTTSSGAVSNGFAYTFEAHSLTAIEIQGAVDTDGDGLSDDDEVNVHGTDPDNPDTDNDGLTDGDEISGAGGYVSDPNDADSDDDGINDGSEIGLATDPEDDQDVPSSGTVWVDFSYSSGIELGSEAQPFNTLGEGVIVVNPSGTLNIETGETAETPRITKAMRMEAVNGTVRIGVSGGAKSAMGSRPGAVGAEGPAGAEDSLADFLLALQQRLANAAAADGEDDESGVSGDGTVHEPVIPFTTADDALQLAQADSVLAIRLRTEGAIDPDSIWAPLPGYGGDEAGVEWIPVADDAGRDAAAPLHDVWVLFRPDETWYLEDVITLTVGAQTIEGESVESETYEFQVESEEEALARSEQPAEGIWQPEYGEDFDTDGLDLSVESTDTAVVAPADDAPGSPSFAEGIEAPFMVGPERVYDVPQRVWLPVPDGVDPNEVHVYYYHTTGDDQGWYPAENVEGWLVPDSYLHLRTNGTTYLGFLVRHAGIVQLGAPTQMTE